MKTTIDYFSASLFLLLQLTMGAVAEEKIPHDHMHEKHVPEYYKGGENIEHGIKYDLILKPATETKARALAEVKEFQKQTGVNTYRAKPTSELNDIYFDLEKLLPANTAFRINSAYTIESGDTKVEIETKHSLDTSSLKDTPEFVSIKETTPSITVRPIRKDVDDSTISIPPGWDKPRGFENIVSGMNLPNDLVKTSIVFENPDNSIGGWRQKPFAPVLRKLMVNAKGGEYGFGYSEGLIWWTQDIDRQQATTLLNEPLVKNLIPREANN